jgi:hypothetical protein
VTFNKISQPAVFLSTGEIANPEAPLAEQRYVLEELALSSGTIVPAIGISVEF